MGEESDTADDVKTEPADNCSANGIEEIIEDWQEEGEEEEQEEEELEEHWTTEMPANAPWRSSANQRTDPKDLKDPEWIRRHPSSSVKNRCGFKIFVGNLPCVTDRMDIGNFLTQAEQEDENDLEALHMVTDINVDRGKTKSGDVAAFYDIMEKQLAAGPENNLL